MSRELQRLVTGAIRAVGIENLADPPPQGEPRLTAEREQRVERRAGRGLRGFARQALEQPEFECGGEIEDVVADGDAAARDAAGRREHAERQVLDRKVGVMVRRGDPASPPWRMGIIDHVRILSVAAARCRRVRDGGGRHHGSLLPGSKCLRKPCQQSM